MTQETIDAIRPLLGTMSDRGLAKRFGVTLRAVNWLRRKLGIPPYTLPHIPRWRLGRQSDRSLGREFGVSRHYVGVRRREQSIRAWQEQPKRRRTAQKEVS